MVTHLDKIRRVNQRAETFHQIVQCLSGTAPYLAASGRGFENTLKALSVLGEELATLRKNMLVSGPAADDYRRQYAQHSDEEAVKVLEGFDVVDVETNVRVGGEELGVADCAEETCF